MNSMALINRKHQAIKRREQQIIEITKELDKLQYSLAYKHIKTKERRKLLKKKQRLTEEQMQYHTAIRKIELTEQERKNWTICHKCGCIDRSGGSTCPDCGAEMKKYETIEQL